MRRSTLQLLCTHCPGTVKKFRRSYDIAARLYIGGAMAAAVRAAGLRPGEKARSMTAADMRTLRQALLAVKLATYQFSFCFWCITTETQCCINKATACLVSASCPALDAHLVDPPCGCFFSTA